MKKFIKLATCAALALACIATTACAEFKADKGINVISREEGSGTRSAFVELTGVEQKINDKKVDMTTVDAQVTNNTSAMMMTVAGDAQSIGYISLGSLSDKVKAVKVAGVEATAENVSNGTYGIARPFNIAWKVDTKTELATDFIAFVMSEQGQAIVADNGYVPGTPAEYTPAAVTGKLVIGGSTSVSPVMEKLIEAYKTVNTGAEIELQTTDSTTGMTSAIEGTYDIGMASRALKEAEAAELESCAIAMDGIAVIVNLENPVEDLTVEQIGSIFMGETTVWSDIVK